MGYASDEKFSNDELIAEAYTGIRPAPGYPSCPEHTIKREMFELMNCAEIGMFVTESLAMMPAASVSGFYFSHPKSEYFGIGNIDEDQLQDFIQRSGRDEAEVRRALRRCWGECAGGQVWKNRLPGLTPVEVVGPEQPRTR